MGALPALPKTIRELPRILLNASKLPETTGKLSRDKKSLFIEGGMALIQVPTSAVPPMQ